MSYITEMGTGSVVELVFKVNGNDIIKKTTIEGMLDPKYGQGIMCELVKHNGQVLNCSIGLSHVIIYDSNTGGEFQFSDVRAVNIARGDALCIFSSESVNPTNKRAAFRFDCNYDAKFRVRNYQGTLNGVVQDISLTGIGCQVYNGNVILNELDDIFVQITNYNEQPNVVGTIARKKPVSQGVTFVGIHMNNPSTLMLGIVHHLEHQFRRQGAN